MNDIMSKLLEFYGPSIRGAELEVPGLKLPKTAKHIFHDDGFVDSVDDRIAWLSHKYGDPSHYEKNTSPGVTLRGIHYEIPVTVTTEGVMPGHGSA